MELKIVETVDNSNVSSSINDTKRQFANLQKYLDGLDFKTLTKPQIAKISDEINEEAGRLRKVVSQYKQQIDQLKESQKSLQDSGDFRGASSMSKQISDIEQVVRAREKELAVLDQYREKLIKADAALDKTNKKKKESIPLIHSLVGETENYNKIISKLPAGLRSAVKGIWDMVEAARAFIATRFGMVIAALIAVFSTLKTYLTSTAEGQARLASLTGYLKGQMMALKDSVADLGRELSNTFSNALPLIQKVGTSFGGLVKMLSNSFGVVQSFWKRLFQNDKDQWKNGYKGVEDDFTKALEGVKEGWQQMKFGEIVGDDKGDEYGKKMAAIEQRRVELARKRRDFLTEEANLEVQIAQARTMMFSGNEAQKEAAAAKVTALNNKLYGKRIALEKEELSIQKDINALRGNNVSSEDLQKAAELEARVINLEAQNIQANMRSARTLASLDKKELQAEKTLQDELNSLIQSNIEKRLELMDDGSKKQVAQIEANYSRQMEAIRKQRAKWVLDSQNAGKGGALSDAQLSALSTAERLASQARDKAIMDMQDKNRLEYLKKYGTFEEKQQAIREEYEKKRKATDALSLEEQTMYRREFEENMAALRKSYSATYALIFADAGQMSDTLLAKAIEATQKEIEEAKSKNDIQALTELYQRLREKLDEQAGRNGLFTGLTQGFQDLANARERLDNAMKADDQVELAAALQDEQSALSLINQSAGKAQEWLSKMSEAMRSFDVDGLNEVADLLGGIGDNIASIVSAFSNVGQEITSTMKNSAITAAFDATLSLINMIGSSLADRKKQQEEWNKTVEQSAHTYAMLKLQELDYQQSNIFGVENPYKRAIDGAHQYSEAMGELRKNVEKLQEGQIQVDTKNGLDWSKIGQGFAKGAGAGALVGGVAGGGIFSWATAAIGAAIGGVTGAVAGAFSTKLVPVMEDLSSQYEYLFDENYELNPQLIADYEKLDDETKQIVDNWQEIADKAKEAEEQMRQNFADISGNIGEQLADSLVDAFRNGNLNSAIDDFHDKMTGTIEDIMEQMVFSATFGAMFDELQQRMEDSFGAGGDRDIVDDLIWMEKEYQSSLGDYERAMSQVRDSMESLGYDVFSGKSETNTSASRAVSSAVTESTASAIEGRLTAIQIAGQIRTEQAVKNAEFFTTLCNMVSLGGETLTSIRDMHILEVSYLADIAKQTKPILGFRDILDSIRLNTSRL